tara:strand:+ start:47 stop:253 length:207 start_codon:yes stop_codon:yes gene_type:complete
MELFVRLLRKYEKIAVIVIAIILTGSFVVTAYQFGELAKDYVWRMSTYVIFLLIFIFVLIFKEELLKK